MATRRRVLVTGGSRGIGAAVVRAFADEGCNVVFSFRREAEKAAAITAELSARDRLIEAVQVDLEHLEEADRLAATAQSLMGGVDILVNNAAVLRYVDFLSLDMSLWDYTQSVNLRAPVELSRLLLPDMIERKWGRIVNLTSIGGQWGGTLAVPYAVSKAALIGLTRSLAKLGASSGVTVNAVSPGLVGTEIIDGERGTEEFARKVAAIPVGRIAEVEEVAEVVRFLASDQAAYITGQTINVNGGMYFG